MTLRINGATSGYVELDSPAVGGNNTIALPGGNGSANQFLKNGSTAGTLGWSNMVEDSSGRLLVGTSSTSASALLTVQGSTSGAATAANINIQRGEAATSITADESIGQINFGDSSSNLFASINCSADANAGTNDYPGRLVLSTTADNQSSPVERARIDNAGRLLVGLTTTAAIAGVSVSHKIGHTASTTWAQVAENASAGPYGLAINHSGASPNGTSNQFLWCTDSSSVRAQIYSNGGLGNFQANNVNLSDINTKKDITPAADTWDCIKGWEIVNYRYKDQPDDADLNLGVIAQQVAENCPEVVTVFEEAKNDQPEKLGVKEQQMYWMAIKALQEAMSRIETLEAEVAALKAA